MASGECWLVSDGQVLASAERVDGYRERARGLLGRDHVEGAFVIQRCRWIHTVGMRFALDVAHLDADGVVVKTMRMKAHRVGVPVWHARTVIEAESGAFARWGLKVGDKVELRGVTGSLVLVSTPIGNLGDLSPRAVETLRSCALICCEDTRHTGKLLSHAGVSGVRLAVANEHTEHERIDEVIALLENGRDVAVVTDAGTPGISDPGGRLATAVIDRGYRVTAVPGPSAVTMALVLSGFDTTRFVFEGFLPRSGGERSARVALVAAESRTVVMYEAPHRVARTVSDLAGACGSDRRVALARELTKFYEDVWRGTLADAVTHLADVSPRGEYVLVLEGAPPPPPADDAAILDALHMALQGGADRKTAIATVMAATGAGKRRVYDLALTIPR